MSHQLKTIIISDEEKKAGRLTPETLAAAVIALQHDGIVVLENATDLAHVDTLNEVMVKEIKEIAQQSTVPFNGDSRATENLSQRAPRSPELMFEDIWANDHTLAVISAILGPQPHVTFAAGNTAMPGGTLRQRVHADLSTTYPINFPFGYVANILLCDVDESKGATEVWPGSHLQTEWQNHLAPIKGISEEVVEARRQRSPPTRACVKKGSIVIRDLRLWHAGIPNSDPENEPRIMVAFVHFAAFWMNPLKVVLPEAARPLVEGWSHKVHYTAEYVPGEVDHRALPFGATSESTNPVLLDMVKQLEKTM
ncbi:hypothetical protein MMC30_005970 [Trapelia coarctata]|nr:hypothetical protein [Trapelia coarctata]